MGISSFYISQFAFLMHRQHPQTAYRKYAVLIGTISEDCDKVGFHPFAASSIPHLAARQQRSKGNFAKT